MAARPRKPKQPATPLPMNDVFNLNLSTAGAALLMQIQSVRGRAQSRAAPPLLYHYTNAAGLLGIIENNKIWATHINYLNDASELSYARQLVDNILAQSQKEAASEVVREFFRRVRTVFDVSRTMDVFISCFCEDGDLLSQWRGYAQAGEGYSIGVDSQRFEKIGGGRNFFFGPVEYNRDRQEQVVEGVIAMLLDGLTRMTSKLSAAVASEKIDECCHIFRRAIWFPLVIFKDAMFAAEQEWRLIEIMTREAAIEKIRFRSAGSKLVPYVELDFGRFAPVDAQEGEPTEPSKIPISRVFHGPTLNPELSVRALSLLLARHGYAAAEVLGSKIPLRL
jgi:Protein of unknown function (DUF2971)